MPPHEPIPVFRKPEPAAASKWRWPNAAEMRRASYASLAFSVSMLIVVIAADVASSA
jgi:hypothetical protein